MGAMDNLRDALNDVIESRERQGQTCYPADEEETIYECSFGDGEPAGIVAILTPDEMDDLSSGGYTVEEVNDVIEGRSKKKKRKIRERVESGE